MTDDQRPISPIDRIKFLDDPYVDPPMGGSFADLRGKAPTLTAAADVMTGAMVALVPMEDQLEDFALPGGEPADQLHITCCYLGDAVDITPEVQQAIIDAMTALAADYPVFTVNAFSASFFNANADDKETALVLGLSGDGLQQMHDAIMEKLQGCMPNMPEQHSPWVAHMTLMYTDDPAMMQEAIARQGPVTLDRIRVAFAGDVTDMMLYDDAQAPQLEEAATMQPAPLGNAWEGILVVEGVETGDGREFAPGSLTWDTPPLPFSWQPESQPEHSGSVIAGRIDEVWRDATDSNTIRAKGVFDDAGSNGAEALRQVEGGFLKGVSVDVDSVKDADVEMIYPDEAGQPADGGGDIMDLFGPAPELMLFHAGRIRGATLVALPAFVEAQISLVGQGPPAPTGGAGAPSYAVDAHSTDVSDMFWDSTLYRNALPAHMSVDLAREAAAWVDTSTAKAGTVARTDVRFNHHEVGADGTVRGANITGCSVGIRLAQLADGPASGMSYADRKAVYDHLAAHLQDAGKTPPPFDYREPEMTAASHVIVINDLPPAEWFDEPTDVVAHGALTVTDEGRVYGYLAPAGVAHRSFEQRIEVPLRHVDYTNFMGGETIVAGGGRVVTGPITMECGHAPVGTGLHARAVTEMYDNSCAIVASVRVGENRHGVWVAGALHPGVTADQITRMMSCRLSGDWRPHRERTGMRELCAALLVPTPGFPMARNKPSVQIADGQITASSVPVRMVRGGEDTIKRDETQYALRAAADALAASIGRGDTDIRRELAAQVHGEV